MPCNEHASQVALTTPADDAPHLLVVDDDRRIRDLLSRFLTAEGYRVTTADNRGRSARQARRPAFRSADPRRDDAGRNRLRSGQIIAHDVDRADPDADRAARNRNAASKAWKSAPTIMSPSRSSRANCRCASPTSSSARSRRRRRGRIRAVRRFRFPYRARRTASAATRSCVSPIANAKCCACSPRSRRTVPRLALAGNDPAANERAVDVQVNRLRRKIERDPANPLFVQTVRGIGYRLVVTP